MTKAYKQVYKSVTTAGPTVDILTTPVAVTRALTGLVIFPSGSNAGSATLTIYLLISAVDWKVIEVPFSIGAPVAVDLRANMDTSVTKLHAVATGLPAAATVDFGVAYTEE